MWKLTDGRRYEHLLSFDVCSPKNLREILMYLIFLETRIIGLHLAADSMGLSSFKIICWAP